MSHRAQQILDAIAALVTTQVLASGVKVYTHRRLTLDPDQDELPAITVDYGEDRRSDAQTLGMIGSLLAVEITALRAATDEVVLRSALLDMRREIHRAVMANPRFAIPEVVVSTYYGGATAPEFNVDGEQLIGALTSTWLVHYRSELTDPGT